MKKTFLLLLLYSFCTVLSAKNFTTPDQNASFDAPDNYSPLTQNEINLKFARGNKPPQFAVGNERRTVSIAYGHNPMPTTEDNLDVGLQTLYQGIDKILNKPKWVEHSVRQIGNRRWIYMEFIVPAIDTNIHNIMLLTPYKGKTLMFNFNATVEDFANDEAKLRQAIESIRLP